METNAFAAGRPKISFCTTCANRVEQLRQTFTVNAALLALHEDVEWVVVNFGSTDDIDDYMAQMLPAASRRLLYVKEMSGRAWHSSIAKNVAHHLASGEIVVNLDCDNFIGDAIETIRYYFTHGARVLHMWSGLFADGTYGRIAMEREIFFTLGGYDESFYPMGYQDTDLLVRASALSIPTITAGCVTDVAIRNTKDDSIRLCRKPGITWRDYNTLNRSISEANLRAGKYVANVGKDLNPRHIETLRGALG